METDSAVKKETTEMFPRWFNIEDSKCDEECYVCAKARSNKLGERGTFGFVSPKDNHVLKIIPSRGTISCSSALREITAYSLLGTGCEQVTRCLEAPMVDRHGNVSLKLERAHGSLINFSRCTKLRQTLPGFEHMSVHFVLWSLLRAVAYMNKCQLVHRDIKPGNILVFPGPRVTLCDFGGCRMVSEALETLDTEMSDTVCTKNYAPPEEKKCRHTFAFDSYSIAATVIHYAMSIAPCYQPLTKVNRKTFTKVCKPYPGLLVILRLLCRCDPFQRYTAQEALQVFENLYPHLVQKYEGFTVSPPVAVPSRVAVHNTQCSWERFHNFTTQVWPCLIECIRACQAITKDFLVDGHSPIAVAFYVLNMLHNVHCNTSAEPCTQLRCYVMLIPGFIRTACLMVGIADDTDEYLEVCHKVLQRHRCVVLHNAQEEGMYSLESVYFCGPNWVFPANLESVIELQNELHL